MPAGVTTAFVVDVEAELIPHSNGRHYVRLVLNPTAARELLAALQQSGEVK